MPELDGVADLREELDPVGAMLCHGKVPISGGKLLSLAGVPQGKYGTSM